MLGLVATAIIAGIGLLERRSQPVPAPRKQKEASKPPVTTPERPTATQEPLEEAERPTPPVEVVRALVEYPVTKEQLLRAEQSERLTLLRYRLRRHRE